MNVAKRTFVTLITFFTFTLILSILYAPIENIKANATISGRCPKELPLCLDESKSIGSCPKILTGKWNGDDGATYWIRQVGTAVMWFGTSGLQEGTGFSNVFHGSRTGDTITGDWVDIPMGKIMQQGKISFTCTQEGGIDKLKRTSQTGGFGGAEFSKRNHILINLAQGRMQSGSCQMNVPSLALFPDGHAVWRAHGWSEDDNDAWVIRNLVLFDRSGNVLHTFPKFSSTTLPTDRAFLTNDPHTSINFRANLAFPASILNNIGNARIISATC